MDGPETGPLIWLSGQRAGIGPLRADLVSAYWEWENEPGAILGYGRQVRDSLENRTKGYQHQVGDTIRQARFTVYDLHDTPAPVGLASLLIDHQVRTAEFLIVLSRQARGRGLAAAATMLTIDYGFHITGLHTIWLKVLEPITAAVRAYAKAGFQPAGRLRGVGYWLGQRCDEILMDALASEFVGPSAVRQSLAVQSP